MALRTGIALSNLSYIELWLAYVDMGGRLGPEELVARLEARRPIAPADHNALAAVLNGHLRDLGLHQPVPYFEQLADVDSAAPPG
jgi:hypothetical protein